MSAQPASRRRDKMSLGHQHMQLAGKMQAQSMESQRAEFSLLGDAGTVTQATSLATPVDLDARNGVITSFALGSLGIDADATITLNNKYLRADALVLVSLAYDGAADSVLVCNVQSLANGSCDLLIRNVGTATTGAADTVDIHFFILGQTAPEV